MVSIDIESKLLASMMDIASLMGLDEHHEGFSVYHIEIGPIGYSISAKRVTGRFINPYWVIRDFSTYNA
jgi:hypothetical protein